VAACRLVLRQAIWVRLRYQVRVYGIWSLSPACAIFSSAIAFVEGRLDCVTLTRLSSGHPNCRIAAQGTDLEDVLAPVSLISVLASSPALRRRQYRGASGREFERAIPGVMVLFAGGASRWSVHVVVDSTSIVDHVHEDRFHWWPWLNLVP